MDNIREEDTNKFGNNTENPFENDELGRQHEIENLFNVICIAYKEGGVVSLDSPWGTGKTSFVKMFQAFLKNKNIKTVYFNAWENDHFDEPLVPLISEINSLTTIDGIKENLIDAGLNFTKGMLPFLVKAASYKFLGMNPSEAEKTLLDSVSSGTEKVLSGFNFEKKNLEILRDCLGEISKNETVYLFIDELDRCKPLFAINLLENIKHVLNLKNFYFIISIDREAISQSLKIVQGNVDTTGYLRRFFDFEYTLNIPNVGNYLHYILKNKYKIASEHWIQNTMLAYLISSENLFFIHFRVSLRDIEKIAFKIYILQKSRSTKSLLSAEIIIPILIMEFKAPDSFKALCEYLHVEKDSRIDEQHSKDYKGFFLDSLDAKAYGNDGSILNFEVCLASLFLHHYTLLDASNLVTKLGKEYKLINSYPLKIESYRSALNLLTLSKGHGEPINRLKNIVDVLNQLKGFTV